MNVLSLVALVLSITSFLITCFRLIPLARERDYWMDRYYTFYKDMFELLFLKEADNAEEEAPCD